MKKLIKLVKDLNFAWRYRRAVRKAKRLSRLFGMRYFVIFLNGRLKVVSKQAVKELVRTHRFRKGVTVADIEKRALFVTM